MMEEMRARQDDVHTGRSRRDLWKAEVETIPSDKAVL